MIILKPGLKTVFIIQVWNWQMEQLCLILHSITCWHGNLSDLQEIPIISKMSPSYRSSCSQINVTSSESYIEKLLGGDSWTTTKVHIAQLSSLTLLMIFLLNLLNNPIPVLCYSCHSETFKEEGNSFSLHFGSIIVYINLKLKI